MMGEVNYDSYCGLYCGACSIMTAYRTGEKDHFASFWGYEMGLQLKCHGCKNDAVFAGCVRCPWRKCARERGVERCLTCGDFPCQLYPASKQTLMFLEKLPHLKTMRKNLAAIQTMGAAHWLAEQDRQWRCPECRTSFSWYAFVCPQCGTDLDNAKDFAGGFDKRVFDYLKQIDGTPPT